VTTESEIRNALRDAFGDAEYPPVLTARVRARLDQPPASGHPRLIALVAAILAIAVVVSLVYIRTQGSLLYRPSSTPAPKATPSAPGPPMIPLQQVPVADLISGALTPAVGVMTDPNLTSTQKGRTVRLIGAYADPARIVLIFRTLPQVQLGLAQIYDDRGLINAGGGGGEASLGDEVFVLDQGPHAGRDGMAYLRVSIPFFQEIPPAQGNLIQGPWTFEFALKVQEAATLTLEPRPTTVGSWKVSVETFELTASVIHLRLLLTGASPDAAASALNVVDERGSTVFAAESSITALGAGLQLDSVWPRPNTAASYQLKIDGGGGHYATSFSIPASPAPTVDPNVHPGPKLPGPYDLPAASESLTLQGAMAETMNFGHVWQCKVISDPSGAALVLELYFRSQQGAWYLLGLVTDLADKPYSGPGTYGTMAYIAPLATNGPADHMFSGTVQLTVTSGSGLFSGTVKGTLNWDDDSKQQASISGGWTCKGSAPA
jgi:hypothetical protein